jgi:hypothetical protein
MPKGIPNKPKDITPPMNAGNAGQTGPAPLILIQPRHDGTLLDVYGLNAIDAIDELRLALLHLVAMQTDLPIIREVISRQTAIALPGRNPLPVPKPAANGSASKPRPYRKHLADVLDDDWQPEHIVED